MRNMLNHYRTVFGGKPMGKSSIFVGSIVRVWLSQSPFLRMPRLCISAAAALSAVLVTTPLFAQSPIARPEDGIQYVSAKGSDLGNGLSWGTAKGSISAALRALPGCSGNGIRYSPCGVVHLGAGKFEITSPLTITSPYVRIEGAGSVSTEVDFVGSSGCAFLFDVSSNSGPGTTNAGGLFDLRINGNASPNVCGVETMGTTGFRMRGVSIVGFTGPGASGWWDKSAFNYSRGGSFVAANERYDVSAEIADCATGWKLTDNGTNYPDDTFGYGQFDVWINVGSNQTAIAEMGGALQFSTMHIIINANGRNNTGISLDSRATWTYNLYDIHMEGTTAGFDLPGIGDFTGVGAIHQMGGLTGSIARGAMDITGFYYDATRGYGGPAVILGGSSDCGVPSRVEVCGRAGYFPLSISSGGTGLMTLDANGNWRVVQDNGGNLITSGTITLSNGSGSRNFAHTYSSAPVCTAADKSSEAPVRVTSSPAGVGVSGRGNDVIAWICTPAAN